MSNRLVITRLVRKLFSTVYSTMDSLSVRSVNIEKGTRASVELNLYLKFTMRFTTCYNDLIYEYCKREKS